MSLFTCIFKNRLKINHTVNMLALNKTIKESQLKYFIKFNKDICRESEHSLISILVGDSQMLITVMTY